MRIIADILKPRMTIIMDGDVQEVTVISNTEVIRIPLAQFSSILGKVIDARRNNHTSSDS